MKLNKLFISLAAAICLAGVGCTPKAEDFKVISFNIRMDGAPEKDGENRWENRQQAVLAMIQDQKPACIGFQELRPSQKAFIKENLSGYKMIGVGRDDGALKGETMGICYLENQFELLDSANFWLSETPDTVSYGWDAACRRTVTIAHLQKKGTDKDFYFFNTHLDHMGPIAREESVKLLVRIIDEMVPEGTPVILGGDMNSYVTEIFNPLFEDGFQSARDIAPVTDELPTYNGYGNIAQSDVNNDYATLIDHFFVKYFTPKSFRTVMDDYGVPYISDHYPIEVIFEM